MRFSMAMPLRLAEYGTCYRYEQSGELFGLMRVRSLNRNGARLAGSVRSRYSPIMSTITVSDLKKKPENQWRKSPKKDELIVTSQGQPIVLLLSIDAESLEPTLSTLRSVRALQAQASLQKGAIGSGAEKLTMADIDAEIAAVRRARRSK